MGSDEKTLDEALLREVAQRLRTLSVVSTVRVFHHRKPASVVARFDDAHYPSDIQRVELELRAYLNGDFNVMYRETGSGNEWMTRWDRHDNPHNTRDHVHRPPRARTEDAVDAAFPIEFFDVVALVLSEIDARLRDVWQHSDGD